MLNLETKCIIFMLSMGEYTKEKHLKWIVAENNM